MAVGKTVPAVNTDGEPKLEVASRPTLPDAPIPVEFSSRSSLFQPYQPSLMGLVSSFEALKTLSLSSFPLLILERSDSAPPPYKNTTERPLKLLPNLFFFFRFFP